MNSTTVTYANANFRAEPPPPPLPAISASRDDSPGHTMKSDNATSIEQTHEDSASKAASKNRACYTSNSHAAPTSVPSAIHGSLPRRRDHQLMQSQFHTSSSHHNNLQRQHQLHLHQQQHPQHQQQQQQQQQHQQQVHSGMSSSPMGHVRTYVRSPVITAVTPTPLDEDFIDQMSREELIARMRAVDAKNRKLIFDNGQMMKDLNQHLSQLQSLKHHNFQLMTDNNELRDLCCYLDDERCKARVLAREWQTFGNHMSRVMKHEVSNYAKKLQQLEQKQFELVRENFELRQLCILLDNAINIRETGDGSTGSMSSSNDPDNSQQQQQPQSNGVSESDCNGQATHTGNNNGGNSHARSPGLNSKGLINNQILQYIGSLEKRIEELEWEKSQLTTGGKSLNSRLDDKSNLLLKSSNTSVGKHSTSATLSKSLSSTDHHPKPQERAVDVPNVPSRKIPVPPVIADAMRVLRIKESLSTNSQSRNSGASKQTDISSHSRHTDTHASSKSVNTSSASAGGSEPPDISNEQHKSIVRSLCHVALKKIEDRS